MVASNESSSSSVSPAKRRANRRNAKKSTGPRTAEGKRRSSRNAVVHGIFATEAIVLDGESELSFHILQQSYVRRLAPQDLVELNLVNQIVLAQWRLNRCLGAEAIHLDYLGSQGRKMARDEIEHIRHDYFGAEYFDPDDPTKPAANSTLRDEEDRAKWERLGVMEHAAEARLPVSAHLAVAMMDPNSPVDRLSRYEQRLHGQITRYFAQLQKLRGTPPQGWSELPPSPYLVPMGGLAGEAEHEREHESSVQDDSIECNQAQPAATETTEMQNEPTEPAPAVSSEPAERCDPPPATQGDAQVFQAVRDAVRDMLNLRQEHLDDSPDED